MNEPLSSDVLVIGSGAAGLALALHLAPHVRVAVVSKGPLAEGNTYYAQGGVSAVLDPGDSVEQHVADTLAAGAGLCEPTVVRHVVEGGRKAIEWLIAQGVEFTREQRADGSVVLHLTREGGHSRRRVVHAADATGRSIEEALVDRARKSANITVYEHHLALDLVTAAKLGRTPNRCLGAYVFDRETRRVKAFAAPVTVLATGGAGKV